MIPFRICVQLPILVTVLISLAEGSAPPKSKRQIYREQVLPSKGGKIPESAFASDRLALNRLNKEGISIPDGLLLEHRSVHVHPHINQHDKEDEDSVIKIIQQPNDRYTAPAGKYHNQNPFTVSSTYIIRKPVGPEGEAIRPPADQVHYNAYNQQHENQIFSTYPETFIEQQFLTEVPSNKYLPAVSSTPHVKYQTNSLKQSEKHLPVSFAPVSQKYVPLDGTSFPQKYLPPTPSTSIVNHPHPFGYGPSISYQEIHQPVSYYPITVPLQLPYKNILKKGYQFTKNRGNAQENNDGFKNIHSAIDLPHFLLHYSQLTDKASALKDISYNNLTPQSLFLTHEVFGSVDPTSDYFTENRYGRTSKKITLIEAETHQQGKDLGKIIQVNCISGSENTIEDRTTQCHLNY